MSEFRLPLVYEIRTIEIEVPKEVPPKGRPKKKPLVPLTLDDLRMSPDRTPPELTVENLRSRLYRNPAKFLVFVGSVLERAGFREQVDFMLSDPSLTPNGWESVVFWDGKGPHNPVEGDPHLIVGRGENIYAAYLDACAQAYGWTSEPARPGRDTLQLMGREFRDVGWGDV